MPPRLAPKIPTKSEAERHISDMLVIILPTTESTAMATTHNQHINKIMFLVVSFDIISPVNIITYFYKK